MLARKPIEAGLKPSPKICCGKKGVELIQKLRLEVETLLTQRETSLPTSSLFVSTGVIVLKCAADHAAPLFMITQEPGLGARVQMQSHIHIAKYRKVINQFNKLINRICPPFVRNTPFCWQNINITCEAMVFI